MTMKLLTCGINKRKFRQNAFLDLVKKIIFGKWATQVLVDHAVKFSMTMVPKQVAEKRIVKWDVPVIDMSKFGIWFLCNLIKTPLVKPLRYRSRLLIQALV